MLNLNVWHQLHTRGVAVSLSQGRDTENMTPVIVCYLQGTNIHFAFDDWRPLEVSNFAQLWKVFQEDFWHIRY